MQLFFLCKLTARQNAASTHVAPFYSLIAVILCVEVRRRGLFFGEKLSVLRQSCTGAFSQRQHGLIQWMSFCGIPSEIRLSGEYQLLNGASQAIEDFCNGTSTGGKAERL
jgi:hypothetical protein